MVYKFTKSGEKAIENASDIVIYLGHNYIGSEHILYGLAKETNGLARKVINNQGITSDNILQKIEEVIGRANIILGNGIGFTPRSKKVIENAYIEAKRIGSDYISTEHMLIGILEEPESVASKILVELNCNIDKMYNDISKILNEYGEPQVTTNEKNVNKTIKQYGIDLTQKAKEGKLDPVIGRNKETERIIEILSRRTKNNPCLIGEPGVGKTAVVEGLAEKIVFEQVPQNLKDKQIIVLDIPSMVAGAKYRGDFEDRVKKVLEEVKQSNNIILFIDEIHMIVGAGAAEGAIDAASILKPLLARGDIQVIGATTINEYRKYIEKDSALERRFQPIMVNEPSFDETIDILKGLRDKYEAHHNVRITDEAINSAVEFSTRYIADRFLPDKAIDLIDEASSKAKLKEIVRPSNLIQLEEQIENLEVEKEEAINLQDFEKAAHIRDKIASCNERLSDANKRWSSENKSKMIQLETEDIALVVSNITGIPITSITEDEKEKLKKLENEIHSRVIGQEEAVKSVAQAIRRSRTGLKDEKRPIASFLFLGPTGVGKTELTKALTTVLFDNEEDMIRVDMSEFMESHSVSKLIGSPPGYVGYEENGELTEKIRRKPYSVILFDEIEKAHSDVMNILLQILDDGRLTDNMGRTVNFKNTVIIMTSNIGAELISNKNKLGFLDNISSDAEYKDIKKDVMQQVKNNFKPEFINRIDDIIVFQKLSDNDLKNISKILLNKVSDRMKKQNIEVKFDEHVNNFIISRLENNNYGARPLKRIIQNTVENKIAEEYLNNNIQKGDTIEINCEDNQLVINKLN